MLAAASVVGLVLNYAFLLAAGRLLGSADYGSLAALLGLLTIVLLPTGAVQLAVSREVSRRVALGELEGADAFAREALRLGFILTVPLLVLSVALVVPVQHLLDIDSAGAVALALTGFAAALVLPISMGALLGYQRFYAVAGMMTLPFALRLAVLALAGAAGYRLGGAALAIAASVLVTTAVALVLLRDPLRRGARAARPALAPFLRYLWPVLVGLIGIAVLTNVDLIVVKARFSDDDAGQYAVASAFARVAFFLPTTVLAVLFPRTAARQARGEDTADILGRTLIVTAAFGVLLTLFYAMTGRGLVHTSFGAEFADGGELLVAFTASMTIFALANVLVGFHLSRDERRYAWIVAAAIPIQIAALVLIPGSVRGVILVDLAIGLGLLVAHELLVGSSVPAIRIGFGLLVRGISMTRPVLVEAALVLLGSTVFVCVLFWPLVSHLGSTVVGDGSDAAGAMWAFWRMQDEGFHVFGTTHQTMVGAPFGSEAGNGANLQAVLPYYPAYLAAGAIGSVAAYNLVLLSGFVLSGASMYWLTRYLGGAPLVSAWAGMVFIVFPWHLARTPHASLAHLEFLPLLLLALVAVWRNPTWVRIALVGLATLACWLTAGYLGAMALVATLAFALVQAVASRSRLGSRVAVGAVAAALGASLLVGVLSIISGFGRGAGLNRVAGDLSIYGLRPFELVAPSDQNVLLGGQLESLHEGRLHGSNSTETENYVGLLTIASALAWICVVWFRRARTETWLRHATFGFAAVLVAALLLAAPSPVGVFGHLVPMPSRFLWELVPAIRVPARWVALAMTALVPLAALGLQAGYAALRMRGRRAASVALVSLAIVASLGELTIAPTEPLRRTTLPPEYEALDRTPDGILAEYPLIEDLDHLFWQRNHGRPVLNAGAPGSAADRARMSLLDPGAPGTAEALALLRVTAIVTHADALDYVEAVPDVPNATWGPGYALVARTRDGASVWRVTAEPAPAVVYLGVGFGAPRAPADGFIGFPLEAPSGAGAIEIRAKAPGVVRLTFTASPPEGTRRTLRVGDNETQLPFVLTGRRAISVLVEVPRGRSRLLVNSDPAARSPEDAILVSAPRATRAIGTPRLHAVGYAADPGL